MFHWFLHYSGSDNPAGPWYGFWSGFGSDLGELTLIFAVYFAIRKHNCHVKGCWRLKTSNDPSVHAPACSRHHSLGHKHGTSQAR